MSPDSESVGSDVLHVLVHGVELNTNDLMVFESAVLTKMERIACRSGKMVPIRTQWSDRLEAAIKGQPEESASSLSNTQTRRSPSVYAG